MTSPITRINISVKSFITKFLIVSATVLMVNIIMNYIIGYGFYLNLSFINPISIFSKLISFIFPYYVFSSLYYFLSSPIVGILINTGIAYYLCIKDPGSFETTEEGESDISTATLTVAGILRGTFAIAINNYFSIFLIGIVWMLTIWIPYINVGTTLALWGFCIAIGRNEEFNTTHLFSSKYRKYIGEFFLLSAFIIFGYTIGLAFMIIPGIIILIAWSQAIYLLVDKNLNPIEAIKISNDITYGEKLTIFVGYSSLACIIYIPMVILVFGMSLVAAGRGAGGDMLMMLVLIPGYLFYFACMISCSAYIYTELSKKLD